MKIFITGGTGFVGNKLVDKLSKTNNELIVLTRNAPNTKLRKNVKYLVGDINKPSTFKKELNSCNLLIHLAAFRSNWGDKKKFIETNSKSINNFFTTDSKVKYAIVISSVYVYGVIKDLPASEQAPQNAKDIYGISKVLLEKEAIKTFNKLKIKYCVVRPSIVYGPGDNESGMIVKLISMLRNNKFFYIGNGENLIHLVYVDDLVNAISLVINKRPENQIYTIAGEKPIQLYKLTSLVQKELGNKNKIASFPRLPIYLLSFAIESSFKFGFMVLPNIFSKEPPLLPTKVETISNSWHYNISKAKKELHYHPKIDYSTGIKRTVKWYLQTHH